MPLLVLLFLCVAACWSDNMSENLSSLVVRRTTLNVESILGSDILGEYPRIDYQGIAGTLYVGNEALYFTGMTSYLLLEDKMELLRWETVKQILKWKEHGIDITVLNDDTTREISHVFTLTDHTYKRDQMWAFLMNVYNDALMEPADSTSSVKQVSTPVESVLERTNSDSKLLGPTTRSSSSSLPDDEVPKPLAPGDAADDDESEKRPNISSLSQAASAYIDHQLTQVGATTLDVQAVEAIAGKLSLPPMSCQYNGVDGKLYAGNEAIYFVGHKFVFWGKLKVLMHWKDIQHIKQLDAVNLDDENVAAVIQIIVNGDSDASAATHCFSRVHNAAGIESSLQALHKERVQPGDRQGRLSHSTTSDSLLASRKEVDGQAVDVADSSGVANETQLEQASHEEPIPSSDSPAKTDQEDWEKLITENNYPTKVVTNHVLDCDLDRFHELFLHDDANHSISKFMESRGDSELKASPWSNQGSNDTRTISYIHPVNAPMAPPQAAARKDQSLRRYGKHGLVLETKTIVKDVPMVDCFYVSDRVLVEARGDKVAVTIEFDIVFVKSTMLKGIISRTTSSECKSSFQVFAKYMGAALGDAVTTATEKPVKKVITKPVHMSYWDSLRRQPLLPFVLSIAVMQLFLLRDVRQAKESMKLMEATMDQMLQLQQQGKHTSYASNGRGST
ncbi:hypothetical protein MPSEU_000074100 [Mayamaea pseudoterrestris]|nr:hypothetical protein MPSEU_000074100 [Mayamaea pseudoterrestris]